MTYSRRQLYALGEPLGDSATRKVAGKTIYGGGGGGGGPTQQTITQSNIPDWLRPQVETVLGGAMQELFNTSRNEDGTLNITGVKQYNPYSANPADAVAGFSPMQQQAFQGAANLQVPGQIGVASDLAMQAARGGVDSAGMANNYGAAGYQSGMLGQNFGMQSAGRAANDAYGYGGMGAGYGAQAAGLANSALGYGQNAANIGSLGLGALQTGNQVGSLAQNYANQQASAGNDYMRMATDPNATKALMSPYMQNVVDVQQQNAQRQSDIAAQAQKAKFAQSGAMGGGRDVIAGAQTNADLMRQKQAIQAQGQQAAFQQAQQAQQFGSNLGLQGLAGAQQGLGNVLQGGSLGLQGIGQALAGQQAGLQGIGQAGQMYGYGMQGANTGLSGVGQAINAGQLGLQGTAQGMQGANTGLQGVQTGLSGYNLLGQQANTLGSLGGQELNSAMSILGLQNQFGGIQQQQQQNIINQAISDYSNTQQYPLQTFNAYNALLRGYAVPGQTATTYQAAPSLMSQVGGLGMGMYGASQLMGGGRKAGGKIEEPKRMATGGIASINRKVLLDPEPYSIQQLQQGIQSGSLSDLIGAPAIAQKQQAQKQAQMAMAAQQQQAQQQQGQAPSIMAELMQPQQPMPAPQGLGALPTNLPEQMAGGGIVAFDDGGEVKRYSGEDGESYVEAGLQQLESRGNPITFDKLAEMYPSMMREIMDFQPASMTEAERKAYIADYKKKAMEDAGEDPYGALRKEIEDSTAARADALRESKGLAALMMGAKMMGTPGGFGAALSAGASEGLPIYARGLQADRAEKRALANMQFNMLDAQRKERMGLNREALSAVSGADKDRGEQSRNKLKQLEIAAGLTSKGMMATRPTSAGTRNPPKDKLPEITYENRLAYLLATQKPEEGESQATFEARMRDMASSAVLSQNRDIGPARAAVSLAPTEAKIAADVQTALRAWEISTSADAKEFRKLARLAAAESNPQKKAEYTQQAEALRSAKEKALVASQSQQPLPRPDPTGRPASAPGATAGKVITEADIAATMAKSGKTRAQVLEAAKAQGYTIQ